MFGVDIETLWKWYEGQKSCGSTIIEKIQHRKELEQPFRHEFIVVFTQCGIIYRLDRRPDPDTPLRAIMKKGCKAYDTVEEVSKESFDDVSDCIVELRLHHPRNVDLSEVLSVCHAIQIDDVAHLYRLQSFNCYFFAWVITTVVMQSCLCVGERLFGESCEDVLKWLDACDVLRLTLHWPGGPNRVPGRPGITMPEQEVVSDIWECRHAAELEVEKEELLQQWVLDGKVQLVHSISKEPLHEHERIRIQEKVERKVEMELHQKMMVRSAELSLHYSEIEKCLRLQEPQLLHKRECLRQPVKTWEVENELESLEEDLQSLDEWRKMCKWYMDKELELRRIAQVHVLFKEKVSSRSMVRSIN